MSANQIKDRFIDSKVVRLFKSLSKEEVKVFKKYLCGTSYKENNDVFKLFEFLKKHHPNFSEAKLNSSNACLHIYLSDEIPKRKFLQLRTNLAKILEDFLIKQQLEKSQPERDFLLINALKDRQLDNLFFQKVKEVRKKWETKRPAGIEQLHNEYKLENIYYDYKETTNIDELTIALRKRIDTLDTYYLAKRLFWSLCLSLNKNYVKNKEDKNEQIIITTILELSDQSKFKVKPEINFFNLILNELKTPQFRNYEISLNTFKKTFYKYSKNEQLELLNFLTHCCIENQRKNHTTDFGLFDLTKWSVEKKIYINNGFIDTNQFINIVNIACRAKNFNWANEFIEKHGVYLESNFRKDIIAFCTATCLFYTKKYKDVADSLYIMRFSNISIGINARCLQLMAYTELSNKDELFFNLSNALLAIIERDKLFSMNRRLSISNFIYFIKKIFKLRYKKNHNATKIKRELSNTKFVSYKKWLQNKLKNYE